MLGTHFHCNPAFVLHAGKGDTSCTGAWSFRRYIGCAYILVMDIYWTCFGSNSNQKCSCQASLDRANFSLPPRPRSTKQMNLQVCSKCICAGYVCFGFLRQAPEPKAEPPNGKGAAAKGLEWCSCDMVKLYAAALRIRWEGTSAEGAILRTVNFWATAKQREPSENTPTVGFATGCRNIISFCSTCAGTTLFLDFEAVIPPTQKGSQKGNMKGVGKVQTSGSILAFWPSLSVKFPFHHFGVSFSYMTPRWTSLSYLLLETWFKTLVSFKSKKHMSPEKRNSTRPAETTHLVFMIHQRVHQSSENKDSSNWRSNRAMAPPDWEALMVEGHRPSLCSHVYIMIFHEISQLFVKLMCMVVSVVSFTLFHYFFISVLIYELWSTGNGLLEDLKRSFLELPDSFLLHPFFQLKSNFLQDWRITSLSVDWY